MQFNEVNWTPVLIALAIGAIAGAILVIAAMRRRGAAGASDETLERRDLEEERDALLTQIRELDDTGTKASAEELGRIRYEMELKLASVLRDLQGQAAAARAVSARQPEKARDPEAAPADPLATVKGFLWGVAGAAAIAALVVLVLQTSEPRQVNAEGGQMAAQQDPELAQLESAIQADPENLDLQVELARAYLMRNQMNAVASITDSVLQKSPDHPRALSYAALVKVQMGQNEEALAMLKSALAKDPALIDGWIHLALVYAQMNRLDEAKAAIASAREKRPDQAAMLDGFWQQIEQQSAAPKNARAAADPSQSVEGVVEMKPGTGKVSAGAAIFLIARDSSTPSGPPVAVKKLPANAFPLEFHLDAGDSMMGQPLPAKMTIEARVDLDGNPMVSNNEPSARVDNVALGSSGVQLLLQ